VTTLLLARHGETDWNLQHKWQGRTGPPLNETGRRQAAALAAQLTDLDAVYSSDSERARETAAILAERHGLEVEVDPRLGEVDFGPWEGLTRAEIDSRFDGAFARWISGEEPHPGDVERDTAMAARVVAALEAIADRHPDGRVLVVTSGGPIRAVRARLEGIDQAGARRLVETVENCALVEVVVRAGAWEPAR
jgi:broad specificity phosphatase PhoE